MPLNPRLSELRIPSAALAVRDEGRAQERVAFGVAVLDAHLQGGLTKAALHEIHVPGMLSLPAGMLVALGLAWRAAKGKPILWVRQDMLEREIGRPCSVGFIEAGFDPAGILLVRGRDAEAVLRAGAEGARCPSLGAVLIEPWGEPRQLDLTATRRLVLSAEASGVFTLLLRAAPPRASASRTRWLVEPAASQALEANAPGRPAFRLRLLRHRGGGSEGESEWCVEWDRDRRCFQTGVSPPAIRSEPRRHASPLSRSVVAFPVDGPAEADEPGVARRYAG